MTDYHYNGPARTLERGRVTIRPARLSDSRFLWRLSMDPAIREMSTRGDAFTFEEHNVWFLEKMQHPETHRIWVMEVNEVAVAQVRYGLVARVMMATNERIRQAEIAVAVSPAHWGKGYAADLLTTTLPWAKDWLGVARMVALVLVGNLRSKFLFERAGFRYVGDEQRLDKDHWRYEKEMV